MPHKTVQIMIDKKKSGSSIYLDARGQANRPRKHTEEMKQMVIDNSFHREENYYSRNKSKKEACLLHLEKVSWQSSKLQIHFGHIPQTFSRSAFCKITIGYL
ncbi:hypothetical protein JTB14_037445 [Gonioctena quinquepunctata]|nr:hypothetical protein JTB14_037445 [Gonioctena quinquepunctata]